MTTGLFKIIFVISLSKFCQSLVWKKFNLFERCAEPYETELKLFSSTSINGCAAKCHKEQGCASAIYSTDKTCITNSETLADIANSCITPVTYIERQPRSSVMGPCLSDSDCLTATSHCNEGTCDCNLGYSYSLSNDNCVERCEEYGATFSKGTHHAITGHNNERCLNKTIEQLKVACVSASFTCRTIEYRINGFGQLSAGTALKWPEDVREDISYMLYQRNCK